MFLGEVSVRVLCLFLIGLFVCLLLSSMSSLYILVINPLLEMLLANVFHSAGCLSVLWADERQDFGWWAHDAMHG